MAAVPETELVRDSAVAAAASYIGSTVMEQFNMGAFKLESEEDQQREQEARPGMPFVVAAKKIAGVAGIELDEEKSQKAGMALHYLLPFSWTPVYMVLRRRRRMRPVTAGLTMGAAMSLIADEGMTPLLGFSAPNRAYPLSTHARAFVAHLVFGVVVAAVVEGGWRLIEAD